VNSIRYDREVLREHLFAAKRGILCNGRIFFRQPTPDRDLYLDNPHDAAGRFVQHTKTASHVERTDQMQRKLALVLTLLALAGTAPLLSACYTTAGAGQDLRAAGKGLERSAERNTNYRP
jgi:predicted small secreted protein